MKINYLFFFCSEAFFPFVLVVFFFACVIIGDWKDLVIAQGGSKGGPITAYVFIIIATVLVGIYCAWLFAVGLSYRLKFSKLIKNLLTGNSNILDSIG